MPMKPGKRETQDEFLARCISAEVSAGYSQQQAVAICYSKWRESRNKEMLN